MCSNPLRITQHAVPPFWKYPCTAGARNAPSIHEPNVDSYWLQLRRYTGSSNGPLSAKPMRIAVDEASFQRDRTGRIGRAAWGTGRSTLGSSPRRSGLNSSK